MSPPGGLPPGLRPTQVNLTSDPAHRYGEPEIAVNPRDPDNIVYAIMSNRLTYQCEARADPNCATFINGQASGFYNVPGWYSTKVFVTFNRGRSWSSASFPAIPAPRLSGRGH